MKLSKYIEQLNEFVKENPEALDMKVIYSRDDEGNGYQEVGYGPSKYRLMEDDGEYESEENYNEMAEEWHNDGYEIPTTEQVVCIN